MRKNKCLLSEHRCHLKSHIQDKIPRCYRVTIHLNFPHYLSLSLAASEPVHTVWRWRYSVGARSLPLKVAPIQWSMTTDFHLQSRRDNDCQMSELTHLLWIKWPPFWQMPFSNAYSCMMKFEFSLKFVLKGPIDNNHALIEIMAWCCIGNKTLSAPMLTQFTDAYMLH